MTKRRFRDRYVLAEGWPNIDKRIVWMANDRWRTRSIAMKHGGVVNRNDCPRYRLVLERVRPARGKR